MNSTKNNTDTIQQNKCPSCGAAIKFDSNAQNMTCEYCGCEFDVAAIADFAQLSESQEASLEWSHYDETNGATNWNESEKQSVKKYICQSCAGEIISDEVTTATKCPYCDNPVIIASQLKDEYRPDLVIPFKIDRKSAKTELYNYLKGKKLLPNEFKSENHIDEISGIYVPFWLFNCTAKGEVTYRAQTSRSWTSGNYIYTKTNHYALRRNGEVDFASVPADGSSKMDDTLMESIEPYDYTQAVNFSTAYLAGYLAQNYDVVADDLSERVADRMSNSLLSLYSSTIQGYDTHRVTHKNVVNERGNIQYALLPVWILNSTYKGEKYTFAMNGQTGKFVGKLPIDKMKAVKYGLATFVLVAALGSAVFAAIIMWM